MPDAGESARRDKGDQGESPTGGPACGELPCAGRGRRVTRTLRLLLRRRRSNHNLGRQCCCHSLISIPPGFRRLRTSRRYIRRADTVKVRRCGDRRGRNRREPTRGEPHSRPATAATLKLRLSLASSCSGAGVSSARRKLMANVKLKLRLKMARHESQRTADHGIIHRSSLGAGP
jgi:hypothetical protein